MDTIWILVGGIVTSVFTSTGLWAWIQRKEDRKSSSTRLIMGLAHTEIIRLGMRYIERGWISMNEYQDYRTYLIEPYEAMGGNGLADRIYQEVKDLPIRDKPPEAWTGEIVIPPKD